MVHRAADTRHAAADGQYGSASAATVYAGYDEPADDRYESASATAVYAGHDEPAASYAGYNESADMDGFALGDGRR